MHYIDTHCHLDGEEFAQDLEAVIQRAREAGCEKIFIPAIDLKSSEAALQLAQRYPGYLYPMAGLHPEEVRADWREQLVAIKAMLKAQSSLQSKAAEPSAKLKAIGEVGLDFYWSREFEQEQLHAFEEQVRWSVETRLPLMIHCRKAQNEMVNILKRYAHDLPGGVFHCFTGNAQEATQLLAFDNFVLGIGGVFTFKKSNLPETLRTLLTTYPSLLSRIVLETDAPYMAPVPLRGQRNEPANIRYIITRLAETLGVSEETVCETTSVNVARIFSL